MMYKLTSLRVSINDQWIDAFNRVPEIHGLKFASHEEIQMWLTKFMNFEHYIYLTKEITNEESC